MNSQLQKSLNNFLEEFEPYQKQYFTKKIKSGKKYSTLISQLYSDLADFSRGGKKMRAFLVYLGYMVGTGPVTSFPPASAHSRTSSRLDKKSLGSLRAVGILSTGTTRSEVSFRRDVLSNVLPICLAFEMTQNFFLIHDDIMDNADLRRGRPTIHKKYEKLRMTGEKTKEYGNSMAILLGDIACVEIFQLVNESGFDAKVKVECAQSLIDVLLETAYGQGLDVENSYTKPTLAQIYQVTDLKSARYSFVAPLKIGALLGGASKNQIKALEEFGTNAGLAFQIQDDILGVFGNEKVLGKSVLSDMREGKNTVLIYKSINGIKSTMGTKGLEQIWGKRNASMADLEKVRKIIKQSGALEWCHGENVRLVDKAKKAVGKITTDARLAQIFMEIADFAASREK